MLFSPVLALFVSRGMVLAGLGVVVVLFVAVDALRLGYPPAGSWLTRYIPIFREEEQRRPAGSTYFAVAALIAFALFDTEVAANAVLFQAVGDPAATAVGSRWGRHRLGAKSLEGSLACLLAAGMAGAFLLATPLGLGLPLVALAAVATALFELLPLPGDDNLRVPLVVAVVIALGRSLF